jgi:hypothetical protein
MGRGPNIAQPKDLSATHHLLSHRVSFAVRMWQEWLPTFSLALVGVSCYLCYFFIHSMLLKYNKLLIQHSPQFSFSLLKAAGLQKFGQYLGILQQIIGEITQHDGILQFGYVVPDHLCHNHPTKDTYLDLGAILALTDEITTVVLMCQDKTHRPGSCTSSLSLSLSIYLSILTYPSPAP